jgi:type I restriction enzyme S subunit
MELRKGYKLTEVGVIPDDWETDKIKTLTTITTGSKNTQDKIDNGEYSFFVRSQIVERINSFSFDGEAVLTAGDGVGTGKVFHYINGKFDFHQRVYKISNFNDKLNGYFFFLYFSNNFYNRIMQMTAKSSVDSVRMEMIADMQIPLPPTKAEQTAIANALSDADALIQSLEKLIAKKNLIKQGAMQELLKPKESWRVKKFGEVFNFKQGVQCPVERQFYTYQAGLRRFIRIIDLTQKDEIPRFILDPGSSHHVLKDDLFMVRYGTPGLLGYGFEGVIANNLFRLIPKKKINTYFFYFLLSFKHNDIMQMSSSTTMAALNFTSLRELELCFPRDLKTQTRIAQILSDMDAEMACLESKLEKYKQIKQGMMQNLLTGRIRLI